MMPAKNLFQSPTPMMQTTALLLIFALSGAVLLPAESPKSASGRVASEAGTKHGHLVASWNFDAGNGAESVSGRIDIISGHHGFADGVSGKALRSDEFGTVIHREAVAVPPLGSEGFAAEAWVAPRAYPWNNCPILTQRDGDKAFYFGINYQGQLQLHAMVDGKWMLCESRPALPGLNESRKFAGEGGTPENTADFGDARPDPSVPLLRWTHVAGTLDEKGALRLFINGEAVEQTVRQGDPPDKPVTIEREPVIGIAYAVYGVIAYPEQCTNVTAKLNTQVVNGNLVLMAGNDLAGYDPAPGKEKTLKIIWTLDGRGQVESAAEGLSIDLGVLRTKILREAELSHCPTYPVKSGITIGRTTKPVLPLFRARCYGNEGAFCSWDGLLDEIKLHKGALTAEAVKKSFAAIRPSIPKPLEFPRMPTAQDMPGNFGAFYSRFHYDENWDRLRRMGPEQDLFVRFENNPCTFVAWNGTTYPVWYPDGGNIGQMFEAFEIWTVDGCHEAMMDRRGEYSSYKILENTPARVVVLWRHALISRAGTKPNRHPTTGWTDWVDDYYTIYPDVVCARRTVLWSSVPVSHHSYAQDNSVLQPGFMPGDVYEREPLTLANINGQETIQTMGKGRHGAKDPSFKGPAVIQRHNFTSRWKPFMIAPPDEVFSGEWTNDASWPWTLPAWHHWPSAQLIDSDGSCLFVNDGRPKSSCLTSGWGYGRVNRNAVEITENTLTRFALCGMTDQSAASLAPLARSWRQAPRASTDSTGFTGGRFALGEKAYRFVQTKAAKELVIRVEASDESPLVNPAVVVENWTGREPVVELNGRALLPRQDCHTGLVGTPAGTNLVVWIRTTATAATWIAIRQAK